MCDPQTYFSAGAAQKSSIGAGADKKYDGSVRVRAVAVVSPVQKFLPVRSRAGVVRKIYQCSCWCRCRSGSEKR